MGEQAHSYAIETLDLAREDSRILPAGHTLIVHADNERDLALARRAIQALDRGAVPGRAARRAERIERLVEVLIAEEPLSQVEADLETDNAALRARYLETVPTLTAADLHLVAGSEAANRSALAAGWKKDGRVFAVSHKGVDRFPAFQFSDGRPRPEIKRILLALPRELTSWQIALWFASGNGWLGDRTPQESLSDIEAVVQAAARMREATVG
ncbi:hypothetical protein GCM10011322_07880 [Salinarimonas ramus]|uniref:DUF2384 domain-containing protein n=2 Tax=Salinarimonas ramus TaxID=690164 RepID=A0A917Q4C8_9HYPH|nr:hypothetical protein GCM10011322_07880 [Salinarimonas ramus]